MGCKIKERCPCRSIWCEKEKPDYENCVQFLITAFERESSERDSYENKLNQIKEIIKD